MGPRVTSSLGRGGRVGRDLRAIAGADRLAELLPLEAQAATGAIVGDHTRAHQKRLQQDDPQNGISDEEFRGHTWDIDAGSEN